jgi:hypothetical protein
LLPTDHLSRFTPNDGDGGTADASRALKQGRCESGNNNSDATTEPAKMIMTEWNKMRGG